MRLPLACLLPALVLALPAQAPSEFAARLQSADTIMDRFYRGDPVAVRQKAVNAEVDAFNAQVAETNARLDRARADAERANEPMKALEAQIGEDDRQLAAQADSPDQAAQRQRNRLIDARNGRVDRYNELLGQAKARAAAYEDLARQAQDALERQRARLKQHREALQARVQDLEAFQEQGRDLVFFQGLNRLLADLRQAQRAGAPLAGELARARALRRELATWAIARQNAQEYGLVVAEAQVGDEPCWFIVDTGASRVCLSLEVIVAAGCENRLSGESTLVLAGGQKIRGREVVFPAIAVNGQAARDVAGSAVPASEVGLDGLLGQSFLRHFTWTLDAGKAEPLALQPR